jgi:hypothetical protein
VKPRPYPNTFVTQLNQPGACHVLYSSFRFAAFACLSLVCAALNISSVNAQQGPAEFSSLPCSTLALGPSDAISHVQRIYVFKGTEQTTQYKFFADDKCLKPLYSFVFKGKVELGQPVAGLADAVEAKVTFERVLFTLDSPRGQKDAATCADGKFDLGVQRDVSNAACLFMQPIQTCGLDYDIVRMKDGVATPGFRTANMCTPAGRPTKLQSVGASFLEQF